MGELVNQGIAKNENISTQIFENLFAGETFMSINYSTPQEYVQKYWETLKKANQSRFYGILFDYIIFSLLYREGIKPFYTHAKLSAVPIVSYDALFICQSTPVSLSLKTSLRERYKQADLEAIALKYVHRKSKCYLLTMDTKEANVQKEKILTGDIIGLDEIVDCNTTDIDNLIDSLKKIQFTTSKQIDVVQGNLIN